MRAYVRVEECARHILPGIREAVRAAFRANPGATYAELSGRFGLTRRQVRHAVRDLRQLSLISVVPRDNR